MADDAANCVFCAIARGDIPAKVVARTDTAMAFMDLEPKAPFHALVISLKHVPSLAEVDDRDMLGDLLTLAASVARKEGLEDGYRVVINTGPAGGQTVSHLHAHVLGGRNMAWPPG